jgi:Rrf2 family iron-sulfur cluster assembly transcriptional regulator
MLWMTKKIDYAFLALHVLLNQEDRSVLRVTEISKVWNVPQKFLSKIMKDLVDADIVKSKYGPGGGYVLSMKAHEVTFRSVIEAVEGPIYLLKCIKEDPDCEHFETCPQIHAWSELQQDLVQLLESKNLEALVDTPVATRS